MKKLKPIRDHRWAVKSNQSEDKMIKELQDFLRIGSAAGVLRHCLKVVHEATFLNILKQNVNDKK